jgi:hypothetical protein
MAELRAFDGPRIPTKSLYAAMAVAIAGFMALLGYLALIGRHGLLLETQGPSYTAGSSEGRAVYLSLFAPVALGGLLILAAGGLERRARLLVILAAASSLLFGILLAIPGSRANLLYSVVPLFLTYAYYRRMPRFRWLVAIAAFLVISLLYGTSLRNSETRTMLIRDPGRTLVENAPRPRDLESLFLIDIAHTEPLLGAIQAYPTARPFMGGESFAFGVTGPVGWKFGRLIGLRPEPPAGVTLTAKAYGKNPQTFGSGVTATLPGEAYANFGVTGIVIGLGAFGLLAGWIRRRALESTVPGTAVLYATAITTLFAIFADYSGQFIRGAAVLVGTGAALIVTTRHQFRLRRISVIIGVVLLFAVLCLVLRRVAGSPPANIVESTIPLYLGGVVALALGLVLTRLRRGDRNGLNYELPPADLSPITVSPAETQDTRSLRDTPHWTHRHPAPPGASG